MSDIYTKSKRSEIMSHISGKETKPEILVRKFLFANGLRFRKNVNGLSGKPDIVLPKYKTVIFIHGCFWHGHTCKRGTLPTTNVDFWKTKIGGNVERDKRDISELEKQGWNVTIIWQCEIKNEKLRTERLQSLITEIKFVSEKQKEELNRIIADENLNKEETEKFVKNAFRDGFIPETGTAITKLLPPLNPFAPDNK